MSRKNASVISAAVLGNFHLLYQSNLWKCRHSPSDALFAPAQASSQNPNKTKTMTKQDFVFLDDFSNVHRVRDGEDGYWIYHLTKGNQWVATRKLNMGELDNCWDARIDNALERNYEFGVCFKD